MALMFVKSDVCEWVSVILTIGFGNDWFGDDQFRGNKLFTTILLVNKMKIRIRTSLSGCIYFR